VALLGAGSYLYYQSSQKKLATPPANTLVQITPTAVPPTPTPEDVEKDLYEIEVQNGSGVAGRAASVKTTLEDESYVVSKTGNADEDTYTKTIIYADSDANEKWLEELRTLLSKDYDVESQTEDINDVKTESDILIIIGKDEAKMAE
jgi:hypothetical protein